MAFDNTGNKIVLIPRSTSISCRSMELSLHRSKSNISLASDGSLAKLLEVLIYD